MSAPNKRPLKARLGLDGYAELLAAFRTEPASILAMHKRLGWGRDTLYRLVTEFHAKGLLHVGSWAEAPNKPLLPVYHYGPGEDVGLPAFRSNGRRAFGQVLVRTKVSPEVLSFATLMDELATPMALYELSDATGVHRDTLKRFLTALNKHGMARVVKWRQRDNSGGRYVALYQLGGGQDVPYPSRKAMRRRTETAWRNRVKQSSPFKALTAALWSSNEQHAEAVA